MIYFNQYFFQTVKTQSILMINKLFYCHHWDLGFNPLVTDFFYHTTSSIVICSWETQAYNVDLIDEYKSQCRELLDMWADIQNAGALLIRDGGQEATVVL